MDLAQPLLKVENKIEELAPAQIAFNPVTMLINAFAQVPNYLQ